jgi:excisionase family DNA binding protein
MTKRIYTVREFLGAYSLSRTTFYRLLRAGKGPTLMRIGRRVLVPADAAEEWVSRQLERRTPTR